MDPSFDSLLHDSGPCVSLLLPLDHSSERGLEARKRVKALARRAEQESGGNGDEVRRALARITALSKGSGFWRGAAEGVALLGSPSAAAAVWFADPVQEGVRVGPRFSVLALLRLRQQRRHFYVLALSRNRCRLVRWNGKVASLVPADGLEESVEAVARMTQPCRLEWLSTGRGRRRAARADAAGPQEEAELRLAVQLVGTVLGPYLELEPTAPLVLAGVETLLDRFRDLTRLPQVLPEGLAGNFDRSSAKILCALARGVVERASRRHLRAELARFAGLAEASMASAEVDALREAASVGAVETLFVADPGRVELLCDAAESIASEVLRRGGAVHLVPSWEMPAGVGAPGIAALLRPAVAV